MTADTDIPYAQKVVSDWLRPRVGTRVMAHPPAEDKRDDPWVQVKQVPGTTGNTSDPVDRVVGFLFQFDCYAGKTGGIPEAERLSRKVLKQLRLVVGSHAAPTSEDDPVVVTFVQRTNGPFWMPDESGAFEPARDRFILEAMIWAHSVGS